MSAIVAVAEPHGSRLAAELADEGVDVAALVRPDDLLAAVGDASARVWDALREADAVVVHATRSVLVPDVVAMCDRSGARIVALADRGAERRAVASFGLPPALPLSADASEVAARLRQADLAAPEPEEPRPDGGVTVVWGPHGAPGRTTLAIALAAARAREGSRVALVDADTHAPSVAQRLGLSDEAPGFASACRQTDYGVLDGPELTRLAAPLDVARHPVEVLTGINRPARWPELSARRVGAALGVARGWVDDVIVDVAAPLEADEEIVSDIAGPRRNAATLASLAAADRVVAVASADAVGIARFVRGVERVREVAPQAKIVTVVNRMRGGALGVDGAAQVRRTLALLADVEGPHLVPQDARAADQALLESRPILARRRRTAIGTAVQRLAATL
ncbi:hypothetical protein [Microbacterium indicum]|uniref:nucleotide-binding protein n=1 Tax=Microbacterium indicum TaxID=358100 RepID=UPI0003FCD4EB|nr:hypothetical protein [Microbacterium indicum]